MNNLVLSMLLFSAIGLAWLNRHSAADAIRTRVHALGQELAASRNALDDQRHKSGALEQRLAELRQLAREAHQSLLQFSAEARELLPVGDFSSEGAWPAARQYFYLPKQYLGTLGYGTFHNNGSLSEEAAQLFGLTPAEKVGLTDLWSQLRLELEQLQLKHAERLESTQPDSEAHREISFRLPALTHELAEINQRFAQDLESQLGHTRGKLLWEKVSGEKPLNGYPMGDEDRIVIFRADRASDGSVHHKLTFTNPSHTRSYELPVAFEPEPNQALTTQADGGARNAALGVQFPLSAESALWNYRHLFGDQPLLGSRSEKE